MTTSWAEIKDGICTNSIYCKDEKLAREQGWVPLPDGYGIGDSYINGEWTKAPQPEPEPADPQAQYKALVAQYIHERYSVDDKIAMLYKDENDPSFIEYREYVEQCKERAYREVYQ